MAKGLQRSLQRARKRAGVVGGAADLGTPNGTGVSLREESVLGGEVRQVILDFVNTPVVLADEAAVVAYGSLKVYDFPEGALLFLGAVADFNLTKSSAGVNDDWDGDFGVGSVAADNNATLSATEQDYIPTTPTPQAVSGATTADGVSTSTESSKVLDGTTTPLDVYLNILVDDADHDVTTTPCNIIVNGTLKITYIMLGDR